MVKANFEQQRVIDDLQNNIILFASAGTGKTFTVAKRVENILKNKNIKPEEILCLTFTVKACNEMKEDIISHVGEDGKQVEVRTIHSFLYQILKMEEKKEPSHYLDVAICDDVDEEELLRKLFFEKTHIWLVKNICNKYGISFKDLLHNKGYLTDDNKYRRSFITSVIYNVPLKDKILQISIPRGEYNICDNKDCDTIKCDVCGKRMKTGIFCPYCGANSLMPYFSKMGIFTKKSGLTTFVSLVKRYYYRYRIYEEYGETVEGYQKAFELFKEEFPKKYSQCISYYVKKSGLVPDKIFDNLMDLNAGNLIYTYNKYLERSNLIDFDDIIGKANIILNDSNTRRFWEKKYKYITIDEMQDTSEFEFESLQKIFGNNNIMMCGDFFQTIYAWRGSNPEKVLGDFKNIYSAKTYMFSENYRATRKLASASFGFLKNMFGSLVGEYCPSQIVINSENEGDNIKVRSFSSIYSEASWIYDYIKSLKLQDFSKVCIMARSNRYIAALVNKLQEIAEEDIDKLKFFTIEEFFQFYRRPLVKDFMAFLKLIINPFDDISMTRIARNYVSGVGAATINKIERYNTIGVNLASFINPIIYKEKDTYGPLIDANNNSNIVVYDTESTGLDLEKDQIIQISAIKIDCKGNVIDIFDQMVIPTVEISQGAYQTHGFDLDYILKHGGISAKDALVKFANFVKGAVLVGHNNLAYDRPLINRELYDNRLEDLDICEEYDTLAISKQFLPKLKNYKLSTLCDYYNVVNEDAHNAVGDIVATGKVLVNLIKYFLVPTQSERIDVLSKYKPRFEKTFLFFEKLRLYIDDWDLSGMVEFMCKTLDFESKYKKSNPSDIIEEIKEIFKNKIEKSPKLFIQELLTSASFSASQIDTLIKKSNRVPLITVHESKGCEFDTVIIAGCTDNRFPAYFAVEAGDEEEEKKVFYVAISRAKKNLILTYVPEDHYYFYIDRSPYIEYIPEEYINY